MKVIEGKVITVKIPSSMLAEIEGIAKKRDSTKADVYRMMLRLGIQAHHDLESVGMSATVDFVHFVGQALRDKIGLSGEQMRLPM